MTWTCKRCGSTKRASGRCAVCVLEKNRRWRAANREKVCEQKRRWREANAEKARETVRRWYAAHQREGRENARRWKTANPERVRDLARRWYTANVEMVREQSRCRYAKNSETVREHVRRWKATNPERVRELGRQNRHVRRARKRGALAERVDRWAAFERYGGRCHICGQPVEREDWHLDHIKPLARGGEHTLRNVAPAHPRCNLSKWAKIVPSVVVVADLPRQMVLFA